MTKENVIKLVDSIQDGETFIVRKVSEENFNFCGFADSTVDDETTIKRMELLEKSSTEELENLDLSEEDMELNKEFITSEKEETSLDNIKEKINQLKDDEYVIFKKSNSVILTK